MPARLRWLIAAAAVFALAALTATWVSTRDSEAIADVLDAPSKARAQTNYRRLCLPCHGTLGAGDGPAAPWLWPRPRDFTRAQYKWRSTDVGQPPTSADLVRVIRYGVPGTSMHGFGDVLSDADIKALGDVVASYAPQKFAEPGEVVALAPRPEIDTALVFEGKQAFTELGCDKCHGSTGRGDGPAAADLKKADGTPETTYDLTAHPFRRPRSMSDDPVEMIYRSLLTGLTGTPMPSFRDAATPRKLWAVSAFVSKLSAPLTEEKNRSIGVAPEAAALDNVRDGYWPGTSTDPDATIWGHSIVLQREPPRSLAPAQASLSAQQCARCHAAQARDWSSTLHGGAASPGLMAQLIEVEHAPASGLFVEGCLRCHAPLAEQAATLRPGRWGGDDSDTETYQANPAFKQTLQAEGINCASCHVREWTRHGPPRAAGSTLIGIESYPLERSDYYERSDFCLGCHQLSPSNLLGDKPLLNTYREWLAGPYFTRGVQCQHCHMPNREHTWKGVHDPDTFRQGIELEAISRRDGGEVHVRARLKNVGAGHYLPTTPTPAAFIDAELLDSLGRPIPGAKATRRIGRHIRYDDEAGWVEQEDSRIPPGEFIELAAAWKAGAVADATELLITVRVEPDEYYERFYREQLKTELTKEQRRLYDEALALAEASHFIALTRRFPIGR